MKKKVLLTEAIRPIGIELLKNAADVEFHIAEDRSERYIQTIIPDYDAVITRTTVIGKEIIDAGSKLQAIGRHGAGLDLIDLEAAGKRGISVLYTPAANARSVAEFVVAMMLALSRRLIPGDQAQRIEGNFSMRNSLMGNDVENKVLGIVGLGRIGRYIAKMAGQGLDMKVYAFDPYVPAESMKEVGAVKVEEITDILKVADFLSFNCALTDDVRGLMNLERLKMMKPTAYIINCARGPIIVEEDLAQALREGIIAGAALDVYHQEPPSKDNPLFKAPNLIATPHLATMSEESMDRMSETLVVDVLHVLAGEKPNFLAPGTGRV